MRTILQIFLLFVTSGISVFAREGGAQVSTASGLQLSDFEKDTGALSWQLSAREAAPEGSPGANVDDTAVWILHGVAIKSFSRGADFLAIETPQCRYSRPDKTASGAGEIVLRGEMFLVRGADWIWQSANDTEIVRIRKDVSVQLRNGAENGAMIFISGGDLVATLDKKKRETKFVFSNPPGQVSVQMSTAEQGSALLKSDVLTVEINASRDEIGGISRTKNPAKKELDVLNKITADGRVHLESESRVLTSDTAVFLRAENTFTLDGNAKVEDVKQAVSVEGGRIFYKMHNDVLAEKGEKRTGTILVTNGTAAAPLPVYLSVPTFIAKEEGGTAKIWGEQLRIALHAEKNVIQMTGNVRGTDGNFQINSEFLEVETPHETSLFNVRTEENPRITSIIAKEKVRVVHENRVLVCENAVITPAAETLYLSGNPEVSLPESGAKLTGATIFLENRERRITVNSSAENVRPRQRVAVSLPPLKTPAAPRAEKKTAPQNDTVISGEKLVMTESADLANFDFTGDVEINGTDLRGSCARIQAVAETRESKRAVKKNTPENVQGAARIQSVLATGAVSLETSRFKVESGRAEIYPQAAIVENSALERNGLDGAEPGFITLAPDVSTPGLRPRLTLNSGEMFAGISGESGGEKSGNDTGGIKSMRIESDLMEIVSGQDQDRFFLRGNVVLSGENLNGTCASIEGRIVANADEKGVAGDRQVSEIIGRGGVIFEIEKKKATGDQFRLVPAERKIFLSGSPKITDGTGVEAQPGKQISFDWKTRDWRFEGDDTGGGKAVIRPSVTIPLTRRTNSAN